MNWYLDPYWWVSATAATATTLAVLVALFGDIARRKWFPPILKLDLLKPCGELTIALLQLPNTIEPPRPEKARYYHLLVSNKRGWSPANHAIVYVTRVDIPGAGGEYHTVWTGEAPLPWRHGQLYSLQRPVGVADLHCDLICLVRDKWLELPLVIRPNRLPTDCGEPGRWRKAVAMIVYVQVKALEAQSPVVGFTVAWDGGWEDGDIEIERHLRIESFQAVSPTTRVKR